VAQVGSAHVVMGDGQRLLQVERQVPPAAGHKDELAGLHHCLHWPHLYKEGRVVVRQEVADLAQVA
jgi:hypothetical protein